MSPGTRENQQLDPAIKQTLGELLTPTADDNEQVRRACIVGVGNRNRGDDGAGPRLIDLRRPDTRGFWFDAGPVPENVLEPIVRTQPDTVLLVDAVSFGGTAGQCRVMDASQFDTLSLSTHAGSLQLIAEYLSARTAAQIRVLAIQPARIDAREGGGEGLTDCVETTVRQLAATLSDLLS